MGMPRSFTENAQFLAMLDVSTFVGKVLQKSYIDVSEEGTEASAVTVIMMDGASFVPLPPPEHVTMEVNRPFIFAITEQSTGAILFMGKVTKLYVYFVTTFYPLQVKSLQGVTFLNMPFKQSSLSSPADWQ
jgi:serpin B